MDKIIELSENQDVSMSDDWYELTSEDNFWLRWRFEAIFNQLNKYLKGKPNILEIGCGNGIFLKQLKSNYNLIADGCDLNIFALENLEEGVEGKIYLYDIYDKNPLLTDKYDLIFLLDVLEHIKDTESFLKAVSAHLKSDGILVVSVPAYQHLYSIFDSAIGHQRRYTKKLLNLQLDQAGFKKIKTYYWGLFLYPVVFIRKYYLLLFRPKDIVKTGFEPPSSLINSFFTLLMHIEIKIFKTVFTGSSVVSIVRKIN